MEYIGVSFYDYMNELKGSRFEISHQIGIQLVELIELFHAKGHVHNDIKPDNYCLDKNGKLSLIDYGLSTPYLVEN